MKRKRVQPEDTQDATINTTENRKDEGITGDSEDDDYTRSRNEAIAKRNEFLR